MKRLSIFGSTGSIGTQTLEVVRRNSDDFAVSVLTCGKNVKLLEEQIDEFKPKLVCVSSAEDAKVLMDKYQDIDVCFGREGLKEAACFDETDLVVNALMGMVGFEPTVYAIKSGKNLALANKETLVSGGDIVMNLAKEKGVTIYPIDSEHSAIFQCLQSAGPNKIKKILLTASGGPFRGYAKEQLETVTVESALKHPNWSMGSKITIDSASMMNKGLEVIEACTLFNVRPEDIEVVVHKESAIHSAIEFSDGSIIAQLGNPDMKIPIAYALTYPNRLSNISEPLDLFKLGSMHFEKADINVFRCLGLAYTALSKGLSYRVVLNASNEIAVAAFLKGEIKFTAIADVVEHALNEHKGLSLNTPEDVLALDENTRSETIEYIKGI